jgi:hypothetical protein
MLRLGGVNAGRLIGALVIMVGLDYLIAMVEELATVPFDIIARPGIWPIDILLPLLLGPPLCYAGGILPSRRPSRRRIATIVLVLAAIEDLLAALYLARFNLAIGAVRILFLIVFLAALAQLFAARGRRDVVLAHEASAGAPPHEEPAVAVASAIADEADWHGALERSLAETGAQQPARRRAWPLVILLIVLLAGWLGFVEVANNVSADAPFGVQALLVTALSLLGVVTLGTFFAQMRRLIRQRRARSAEQELHKRSTRRPVFYLRSFSLDAEIGQPTPLDLILNVAIANREEACTTILRECGPVIAIGRPGEKLPALGAARFYVSHELWQQKVADVVSVAQLVVWATGVTAGLRWEIGHLLNSVPPEKLILWAHPQLLDLDQDEKEAEWRRFRTNLGPLFPKPFPERLGATRFFYFNEGFEPAPSPPGSQEKALVEMLKAKAVPPFDPNGFKRRTLRNRLKLAAAIGFMVVCLGFIAFAILSSGS